MSKLSLSLSFTLAAGLLLLNSSARAAELTVRDTPGQHLDILHGGKRLVRYMYAFDDSNEEARQATYKPYHHVFDAQGSSPITKGPGGKYTHHRGIFLGFSRLGHAGKNWDLWHMKNTNQVHQNFTKQDADDKAATVASVIHWLDGAGQVLVEETRTVTVHHSDDAHLLLDFVSQLKAASGDIQLNGDPEHAGFQYRPSNDVATNKSARYTFPRADTNPQRALDLPWTALTYKLEDDAYTVQHMNHPDNPPGTRYSAYRDYGRFGAFSKFEIKDGQTRTLSYRIRIQQAEAADREAFAAHYKAYVGK